MSACQTTVRIIHHSILMMRARKVAVLLQRGCIELRPRKNCPGQSTPDEPKNSCENIEEVSCDLPASADRCRALVLDLVSGPTAIPAEVDSYYYFRNLSKRLRTEQGCKTFYYNHNDATWKYLCERVDRLWTLDLPMDGGIRDVAARCEILVQSNILPFGFCQVLIPDLENETEYDVDQTLEQMRAYCLESRGAWGNRAPCKSKYLFLGADLETLQGIISHKPLVLRFFARFLVKRGVYGRT